MKTDTSSFPSLDTVRLTSLTGIIVLTPTLKTLLKPVLAACGFYTRITGRAGPLEKKRSGARSSASASLVVAGPFLLTLSLGCASRPECAALRDGMDQATRTIRAQHRDWAEKLHEGKQAELPTLTPAAYRAVLTAHREYEALVAESRETTDPVSKPLN